MNSLDYEWESFLSGTTTSKVAVPTHHDTVPTSTPIYISTKTIITFLDHPVDLKRVFWKLDVISYGSPEEGIIKKQMKFNSTQPDEIAYIEAQMERYECCSSKILQHIDNINGRIKFKDTRKVTVGISKKDLLSYRIKQKGAFYNCFVMYIRVKILERFREFHVKVFNTGKVEFTGIQDDGHLKVILKILLENINRSLDTHVSHVLGSEVSVLINSNFNCGYFIHRDKLFNILRHQYHISAVYDPCSYPGIQCKLYYNDVDEIIINPSKHHLGNVTWFMVFRTGSILIVGKCNLQVLNAIYLYLTEVMIKEYKNIVDLNCSHVKKILNNKRFRKKILIPCG